MHIKSVRLRDEHLFTCVVDSHEKGENRVRSHSANLTVVQPPTSLLISANQINSQEADQNNSEQVRSICTTSFINSQLMSCPLTVDIFTTFARHDSHHH